MKRIIWLGMAVLALLATSVASGKPAPQPLHPAFCVITGANYSATTRRVAIKKGSGCFERITQKVLGKTKIKNYPITGQKWSWKGLVATASQNPCPVSKTTGMGNAFVLQASAASTISVSFGVYVAQNKYHQAAKPVTRTFTIPIGDSLGLCSGEPTSVDGGGPVAPGGGSTATWVGGPQDDGGVASIPTADLSGNGGCTWQAQLRPNGQAASYQFDGMTIYPGNWECGNHFEVDPILYFVINYSDGTPSCKHGLSGVESIPLPSPSQFAGSMQVEALLYTYDASGARYGPPADAYAPITIQGTGTAHLC